MALDPAFRDMYPDRIQIQKETSRDLYQKPVYSPAVVWIARVVRKPRQYLKGDGATAISAAQVWIYGREDGLPGPPDLRLSDRLILPGGVIQGNGSVLPATAWAPIVNINVFPDETGVAYEVAYLGV